MQGLGQVLSACLQIFQIEFTVDGLTFTLWNILLWLIVAGAVIDSHRNAWALTRFGAGVDHPLLMTFPEGEYLKGLHLKLCD